MENDRPAAAGIDGQGEGYSMRLEADLARYDRWATVPAALVGLLLVGYCLGQASGWAAFVTSLSILASVLVACGLSGALAGFVFGIPRLLARSDVMGPTPSATPGDDDGGARAARFLAGNTNLEEISDWVTKILVGLGLVHANAAVSALRDLSSYVAERGLGGAPASELMVMGAGLSSFLLGFLYFYLQTRTRITLTFFAAEGVQSAASLRRADVAASNVAPIIAGDGLDVTDVLSARMGAPDAPAPPVAADAAILRVGFDALRTAKDFAAWGAAQARARNYEAAETALQRANALDASDPIVLRRLAEVRALRGDVRRAVESLREAAEKMPSEWRIRRRELFHSLYLPMPDSFMRAIAVGDGLATHPEAQLDPMVHIWRACAYGQRHRWLTSIPGTQRDMVSARNDALTAVKRAVALAPEPTSPPRVLLRRLLDPAGDPTDNDLADFVRDPDFIAIANETIGRPRPDDDRL